MLSLPETEVLERAYRLIELSKQAGWKDLESIATDIAQRYYPDPTNKKYDLFPWKNIEKDYTFARGATQAVKEIMEMVGQQKEIAGNLQEKASEKDVSYNIGG